MSHFSSSDMTISYSDLSPENFINKMKQYGCLVIKNLFSPSEIQHLVAETLDLFYLIKNLQKNNLLNANTLKFIEGGHPAGILPSLSSLESVLDKKNFVDSLMKYFGKEKFVVNVESTGIRRCDPTHWKNFLPWHQDIFDRDDRFVTCWMPLMAIDSETPGLDLVPFKLTQKLGEQDGIDVAYNGKGLSDDLLNEKASPNRWRPQMELGDVIVFDPYCPHRTSYDKSFSKERYSIDIRIHPKDCIPEASWKTNVINLPSTKNVQYEESASNNRTLFDFRHLVSLNLESPTGVGVSKKSYSFAKALIKKILPGKKE